MIQLIRPVAQAVALVGGAPPECRDVFGNEHQWVEFLNTLTRVVSVKWCG